MELSCEELFGLRLNFFSSGTSFQIATQSEHGGIRRTLDSLLASKETSSLDFKVSVVTYIIL